MQFYRSTNLPLTYQTATGGQNFIQNPSYGGQRMQPQVYHGHHQPGIGPGGVPLINAGVNQKLVHQFMLKQQFQFVEGELNQSNLEQQQQLYDSRQIINQQQHAQQLRAQSNLSQQYQQQVVMFGSTNKDGKAQRMFIQSAHSHNQGHQNQLTLSKSQGRQTQSRSGQSKQGQQLINSATAANSNGQMQQQQQMGHNQQNSQHLAYFQGMYNEMVLKQGGHPADQQQQWQQMGNGLAPYGSDARNTSNSQANVSGNGYKRKEVQKINTSALTSNIINARLQQNREDFVGSSVQSTGNADSTFLESSFALSSQYQNNRPMHSTQYGGNGFRQQKLDLNASGQVPAHNNFLNSSQFVQLQGTPNRVDHPSLSKYGSSIVHPQAEQSNGNFDRDEIDHQLAVTEPMKSENKVRLPEIAYGVSQSTEVPDGIKQNFNSDPYALRIKPQGQTVPKTVVVSSSQKAANADLQMVNSAGISYKHNYMGGSSTADRSSKGDRRSTEGNNILLKSPQQANLTGSGGDPAQFTQKSHHEGAAQQQPNQQQQQRILYAQQHPQSQQQQPQQVQHSSLGTMGLSSLSRGPGSAQSNVQHQRLAGQGQQPQMVTAMHPAQMRQQSSQFSPGQQNSMVSNIKNIYKDIKREKSSGHMHIAPVNHVVNRTNSAHSRTQNQAQGGVAPISHTMQMQVMPQTAGSQPPQPQQQYQQIPQTSQGMMWQDANGSFSVHAATAENRRTNKNVLMVRQSPSQAKNGRTRETDKLNSQRMSQQLSSSQQAHAKKSTSQAHPSSQQQKSRSQAGAASTNSHNPRTNNGHQVK